MGDLRDDGPRFIVAEDLEALERFASGRAEAPEARLVRLGLVAQNTSGWSLTKRGEGTAEEGLDRIAGAQL